VPSGLGPITHRRRRICSRVSTAFRLSSYSPRSRTVHCFYNKVVVVIVVFGPADDRV